MSSLAPVPCFPTDQAELSSSLRHIFYHQPHPLPLFEQNPDRDIPRSSLFADGPDAEGYRLAKEGSHSIPFRMRLPLNGGAKGSFTSPNGKTPSVRYVVVGSIKIHVPSSGKRSIAHFYRQIVVLPYLNPAILLSPSPEPIEAKIERGLGWSLGGDKGRVELRVALGRRAWVSGQRIWCEVAINNQSTRKVSHRAWCQALIRRSNHSTWRYSRPSRHSHPDLPWTPLMGGSRELPTAMQRVEILWMRMLVRQAPPGARSMKRAWRQTSPKKALAG